MGEDSSPEEDQVQQDQAPEQMETEEEEEDLPMEEATSKPPMGMKTAPAKYQPASPKYVRDEEEKDTEDDNVEAPYLAPKKSVRAHDDFEEGLLTSSSESIPDLINIEQDEDIPPHTTPPPPISRKAVCPVTVKLAKDRRAAAILVENSPLLPLPLNKGKPGKKSTPEAAQEGPVSKEEVPEESIIYIDDDAEPSPLTCLLYTSPSPRDATLSRMPSSA